MHGHGWILDFAGCQTSFTRKSAPRARVRLELSPSRGEFCDLCGKRPADEQQLAGGFELFFLEGLEELTAGVSPTAQLDDICIPGYAVIDDIAVDFQIVALEQPLA
ncbi:uncharacterized protein METZ01_LOCUS403544, partial [marine metagenome]